MNLLMLSLGLNLETQSEYLKRHELYAQKIGKIWAIGESQSRLTYSSNKLVIDSYPPGFYYTLPFRMYRRGLEICKKNKMDLITAQDPFATGLAAYLMSKKTGIPFEIQNHSCFFENQAWVNERYFFFRALHFLGKRLVKKADLLRVVNPKEKEIYQSYGIPSKKIFLIPVPVDAEPFFKTVDSTLIKKEKEKLGLRPDKKTLLWIGRPVPFKNLSFLISVVEELARKKYPIQCLLGGDFSINSKIADRIRRSEFQEVFKFGGFIPQEKLALYYQMGDIYLHTSVYEGFGRVLFEAMASGLPVVATESAGARYQMADNKTGFLVEPNRQLFCNKVISLLENPQKAQEMGAEGRDHIKNRGSYEEQIERLVSHWNKFGEGKLVET